MLIENVQVFQENCTFMPGKIRIEDGKFAESENISVQEERVDGEGCYAIPGLVDLHFHGCVGHDLCDASEEGIQKMAQYEATVGVTSICPATMTLPEEVLHQIMSVAGRYKTKAESKQPRFEAKLAGVHMEGPFLSAARKGAQAAEHIRKCDIQLFRTLQSASQGMIKLVDVAPEESGAFEFIEQMREEVVISLAHTEADYETASRAFAKGASHVAHLFNAMPPLNHRNPGVIGAARDASHCHVELICDGVHVHPSMVRAAFSMFGPERMILISDSMRATGLNDGWYTLGGQDVCVTGKKAVLRDGTIAGSVTDLMGCLRTAVLDMGISLENAVACATMNPAKEIGIFSKCGSISVGKDADLVLLDQELNVKAVYVNGIKR
ncbi:MAG: N-acetylglucosamine-6-phosphate deacetylase [Hespellia sp.]|nr:N-acetylglucosamine-6-phosphate deacetylase [Hespellia sp.]